MKIDIISELYQLISDGISEIPTRSQSIKLRKSALLSYNNDRLVKIAFDTRRIDQETEYIPRRGLQNYHRSEKFISDDIGHKILAFTKLKNVLDYLKGEFGNQPEWQDSYVRVLHSSVNKGLRTSELDGDFSDAQPAMASLDYLEELLYVRYRLSTENLMTMSEASLKEIIMKKDELLSTGDYKPQIITPSDVSKYSYEQMMNKMLETMAQMISANNIQKTSDVPVSVKETTTEKDKSITITIKV